MKFVIEADSLFIDEFIRHEQILGMASRSQATGVIDLRIGLRAVFPGHILDDGIDRLKLGPQKLFGFRRIMAQHAGDIFVF
jgi:hypothetical protein